MDGLEQASETTGTSGRGNSDDCFGAWATELLKGRAGSGGQDEYSALARTVEGEIIPRLLLSQRIDSRRLRSALASGPTFDIERVESFTRLIMTEDVETASAYLECLKDSGVPSEFILLDLLGPTARRLGEYWLADECSFFDVTMGLCRLQQLLRDFGREMTLSDDRNGVGHRCLLAPSPGEQHVFGVLVVEEFFRRAGWDTMGLPECDERRLLRIVGEESFHVVGLSMSCDRYVNDLTSLVRRIRSASSNPDILVMVGGQWFNEDPSRKDLVGADLSAVDGRQAIVQTRKVLRLSDARP